jgi:hypothetical protein
MITSDQTLQNRNRLIQPFYFPLRTTPFLPQVLQSLSQISHGVPFPHRNLTHNCADEYTRYVVTDATEYTTIPSLASSCRRHGWSLTLLRACNKTVPGIRRCHLCGFELHAGERLVPNQEQVKIIVLHVASLGGQKAASFLAFVPRFAYRIALWGHEASCPVLGFTDGSADEKKLDCIHGL